MVYEKCIFRTEKRQNSQTKQHSVDNKRDYSPCFKNKVTFIVAQIYIQ